MTQVTEWPITFNAWELQRYCDNPVPHPTRRGWAIPPPTITAIRRYDDTTFYALATWVLHDDEGRLTIKQICSSIEAARRYTELWQSGRLYPVAFAALSNVIRDHINRR